MMVHCMCTKLAVSTAAARVLETDFFGGARVALSWKALRSLLQLSLSLSSSVCEYNYRH